MKKLFVLLLSLIVAMGAFAQLTINGYNRTITTFDKDGNATLANRLRMNLSFNDADGNFGVWGRLQDDAYGSPTVKYAYGWAKLFDGKAKVSAGLIANYDYLIGTGVSDTQLGNVQGGDLCYGDATKSILLQVFPVEALSAAVMFIPSAKVSMGDFMVDAKYTLKDIGAVTLTSHLADDSADTMFGAAFTYSGMEGLSASAGYYYGGNAFYKGLVAKQSTVYGVIDYGKDALSAEIAPVYNLTDSKIYVEGYVGYKVGAFTVNVIGAYDQAGDTLGTGAVTETYKWPTPTAAGQTATSVVDKAAAAAIPSTYFFGLEANYAVGKANFVSGFYYDEAAGFSVPLVVKVGF